MKRQELYNIIIEQGEIFTGLSEDEFLDKMVELSQCYYETGYPSPDLISHQSYNGETSSILDRDQNSDNTEKD
jgi:hypothetical protein